MSATSPSGAARPVSAAATYDRLASRGLHSLVIAAVVVSILVLPVGIASSSVMAVGVLVGLATLALDRGTRDDLNGSGVLRLLAGLLALVLVWQALGVLFRETFDPRSISVLYSALAIAMLLPVTVAAIRRDPRSSDRLLQLLFVLGSAAAAISIVLHAATAFWAGDFSLGGILGRRLVPIGRAHHEILGAGGLASTFFAGVALWQSGRMRASAVLPGLGLIAAAIALTQSRGPIVGLALALALAGLVLRLGDRPRRLPLALALILVCFATPFGLVLAEPWIKALVCSSDAGLCRVTARQDVWATVLAGIPQQPWFGVGPAFRFPAGQVPHAHNGLLGLGFFFGIPMAILFAAIVGVGLAGALRAPAAPRFFAVASTFFSAAFVATDLANPFAFINTHYLFLWIPLMVGASMGARVIGKEDRPEGLPPAASDG